MHILSRLVLATLISGCIASPSYSMSDAYRTFQIESFKARYAAAKLADTNFRKRAKANSNIDNSVSNRMVYIRQSIEQDIKESGVRYAANLDEWMLRAKLKELVKGDHYVVNIWYENDNSFPELYYERDRFVYNDSEDFYNKMVKTITEHYLGSSYRGESPKLGVVTPERVGLQFLVKNYQEFESLMRHPLIKNAEHMGNFHVTIIEIDD